MNNNKQLINILRIINNSPKPMRTDKGFSGSDVQLIIQLKDEDYVAGNWTFTRTLPITNIRPTIKGYKYQKELEKQLITETEQKRYPLCKEKTKNNSCWYRKPIGQILIIVVGGLILWYIVNLIVPLINIETGESHKDSVLQEINSARDMLDYTLLQRQENIRTRPAFSLVYQSYIPDSFADNLPLKTKLINLYQSLLSAQESAKELMSLLSQDNSDSVTINNIEDQIERVIKLADEVGPQVAKHIGKTWEIPPVNMSRKEKIQYYQNKRLILNSTGTDTNISPLWQIK